MGSLKKTLIYLGIALGFFAFLFFFHPHSIGQRHQEVSAWMESGDKPRILATTAIVGDIVGSVGRDSIDLLVLMQNEVDPHSYEIVKGDAEKFARADVVFASGLGLEHSASMQARLAHHGNVVFLGDEIRKKAPEKIIYIDRQLDPHIWMDLSLWVESVDAIVEKLSRLDPIHASLYKSHGEQTKKIYQKIDREVFAKLQAISSNCRYLVTSHDAFNYFGRRYLTTEYELQHLKEPWQARVRAIQGLAPDEQISPLEIIDTVNFVCTNRVHIIFPEANLSPDALHKVLDGCHRRGFSVGLSKDPLYGDTLGGHPFLQMIAHNVAVMERGFSTGE